MQKGDENRLRIMKKRTQKEKKTYRREITEIGCIEKKNGKTEMKRAL